MARLKFYLDRNRRLWKLVNQMKADFRRKQAQCDAAAGIEKQRRVRKRCKRFSPLGSRRR